MSPDPASLRILSYPAPVLRQKAAPVEAVDDHVRRVVARLFDLMHDAEGIGLAAPQVGLPWRLFVVDAHQDHPPRVFINPELSAFGGDLEANDEGCLSLPGIRVDVRRPTAVTVTALDELGQPFTLDAVGLTARVVQHEYDHLNGVLIIDKMNVRDRLVNRRAIKELEAAGSEVPFGGSTFPRTGRGR